MKFSFLFRCALLVLTCVVASFATETAAEKDKKTKQELENSKSRISDEQIPVDMTRFPKRPKPPIELGDKILGQGPINKGFTIPTGARWQPSLWAFGNMRTAVQSFDSGDTNVAEAASRLDLFTNLRLTGTERIVAGFRPLDRNGSFTRYQFQPEDTEDFHDETNLELNRLFFEGDFSELFPRAGRHGGQPKQLGFVLGRQPLFIQEGIMINDNMDAFGITRNNIPVKGTSNFRISALAAWNQVHRGNNKEDDSASLFGVFTEWDSYHYTYSVDIAHVAADETTGSGSFIGISRRANKGRINTQVSVNASFASDEDTAAMADGVVVMGELSFDRIGSHDLIYLNAFAAFDNYTSASRGPSNGGPFGRLGLLYASVGLGGYKAALSNGAGEALGFSAGLQHFFNTRQQLIIELGTRIDQGQNGDSDSTSSALGCRFQQAMGRHFLVQADIFAAYRQKAEEKFGSRVELRYKF